MKKSRSPKGATKPKKNRDAYPRHKPSPPPLFGRQAFTAIDTELLNFSPKFPNGLTMPGDK